jgi:hypothetical protein
MGIKLLKKKKSPDAKAAKKGAEPQWYYIHDGQTHGPLGDADLCRLADGGGLLPSDIVWRDDDPGFRPQAAEVGDLFPNLPKGPVVSLPAEKQPRPTMIFETSGADKGSVMCPYCWYRCEPEDLLYVARHPELIGDAILGRDEHLRFRPSRFTPEGLAIDAEGVVCPDVACPRCHMRIPRSLLTMPPLFLSVVGAPASGKSYFLTSMCWQLRRTLMKEFRIRFADADGVVNRWLNAYEERLFVQANDESYQAIDKTQLQGDLYRTILFNGMPVSLSLPSVFTIQADESSVLHAESRDFIQRSLVLYDNAGEHFEPGRDSAQDPGTHHLIHSRAILFSFDPTKDPSFRRRLQGVTNDAQVHQQAVQRQDVLLTEMVRRIRLYLGLDVRERFDRPVIMMLSKADVLGPMLGDELSAPPWKWDDDIQACSLDLGRILRMSFQIRSLLEEHSPETVSAVESFATDVLYVPVSALGHSPRPDPSYTGGGTAPLVVRPGDVRPHWVEVPFLHVLHRMGYVAGHMKPDLSHPVPESCEFRGGQYHFTVPGTGNRVRLPRMYRGVSLQSPANGGWFRLPEADGD